ncbi:hypothetical protein WICMUC_005189 [Wickerhamomyces mucosus]|uniref:F-box domain-containing protein n=1 Tax=Wickerhamomyces mucosus TaxID=1378264 RepID=A0A9P8T7F2_9ASCO|nr:hypothetical protein WICMUC_005189 [Wickerhamomyces mucosus]
MKNILLDLPSEILFNILGQLDNHDIDTLFSISPIRFKIKQLFIVLSDISISRQFKNIERQFTIQEFFSKQIKDQDEINSGLLWAIVEINDLQNSFIYFEKLSRAIKNRISIFNNYVPITWETENNNGIWMQTIYYQTEFVIFENLTKLSLCDLDLNPKIFKFPNLQRLKLSKCRSINSGYFEFPKLNHLVIDGAFNSLNNSIDFENSNFTHLTLSSIRDLRSWSGIENNSLKHISIFESGSLVKFSNLKFHQLESFTIKDSDIELFQNIKCENLIQLHIEQFMNSTIILKNLDFPMLKSLLLWVFRIEELSDLNSPALENSSIMLSNEPEGELIDFSSFQNLKHLQICCAAEILKVVDNLNSLEVRGPFRNPLLFQLEFQNLEKLAIYFNNTLTELPKINAPNLGTLSISRCAYMSDVSNIQIYYPYLKECNIEYSGLSQIKNIEFPTLERFLFLSSSMSQAIKVIDCQFPKLIKFEAINLEIKSLFKSVIQFLAPKLQIFRVQNFAIMQLTINKFPILETLVVTGGIENLILKDCENLKSLDISKNLTLTILDCCSLDSLIALNCDETPIKKFKIYTPMLERIELNESIRYIRKRKFEQSD